MENCNTFAATGSDVTFLKEVGEGLLQAEM